MSEPFDLHHTFAVEVAPLVRQIARVCKRHNLSMIAAFWLEHREDGGDRFDLTNVQRDGKWHKLMLRADQAIRCPHDATKVTVGKAEPAGE